MVPRDANVLKLTKQVNAFVRVWSVTNDVPEAPNNTEIAIPPGICDYCLKCGEISMNIGHDEVTHCRNIAFQM
jgi:hypothetical protein